MILLALVASAAVATIAVLALRIRALTRQLAVSEHREAGTRECLIEANVSLHDEHMQRADVEIENYRLLGELSLRGRQLARAQLVVGELAQECSELKAAPDFEAWAREIER